MAKEMAAAPFFYTIAGGDAGWKLMAADRAKKFIDRKRWFLYKREK